MTWFSRKARVCPICSLDIDGDQNIVIGHVMTHMDDAVPGNPSGGLRLACGCRDAVWTAKSNFPLEATEHLHRVHGMRR